MSGATINLSLLSRGVGEVHTNGHEKVDVYLEPEDYLNFSANTDRLFLPPVDPKYAVTVSDNLTTRYSRDFQEFKVPKTYSTRKGALLLFSEDLAQSYTAAHLDGSDTVTHQHGADVTTKGLHAQASLKTVEDLANSILKYGGQGHLNDNIYLKFVRAHCGTFERQFRPGFSAKRYLSTWTRTWDDSVFDNIVRHGYLTEKSLHMHSLATSGGRRRLAYEDLSRMPEPYKLMRNMLATSGSLSGYTFYSLPGQDFEVIDDQDQMADTVVLEHKLNKLRNIHIIKTKGRVQKEVLYHDLDHQAKKEVITDLLVKSAVHYALRKQEEVYKDMIIRAMISEESDGKVEATHDRNVSSVIQEFDMMEAVESLLESQHGRMPVGADLSEIDDRSYGSDRRGSFKGTGLISRSYRHQVSRRSSLSVDGSESEKDYMGSSRRDSSSFSNVPVLPPIRAILSPIGDVSRETSQYTISLPPLGQDSTILSKDTHMVSFLPGMSHHPALTGRTTMTLDQEPSETQATRGQTLPDIDALSELDDEDVEAEDRISKKRGDITQSVTLVSDKEKDKIAVAEYVADSFGPHHPAISGMFNSATGTLKMVGNWKSYDWKTGRMQLKGSADIEAGSQKGSRIMAPDGEIINVGGSVPRASGNGSDGSSSSDIPRHQKNKGISSDTSSGSDDNLTDKKRDRTLSKSNNSLKSHETELESRRLDVSEDEILDMLTNHARHVAENVLSHPLAGTDLETDVKLAAKLWSEMHPSKPFSRVDGIGEAGADVVEEIRRSRPTSSRASSVDEYKSLIRKSLNTAVAKAAGLEGYSFPDDAEISPELLEALVNHKMTFDQIEVVTDSNGRTWIQAKGQQTDVLGNVQEGRLHIPSRKDAEEMSKQQISIPDESVSLTDAARVDQVQGLLRNKKKPTTGSGSPATKKTGPSAVDQEVKLPGGKKGQNVSTISADSGSADKKADNAEGKTGVPQKMETSKESKKKGKSSEGKEEPFIVGMPQEKKVNSAQPRPQKEDKKGKQKKKKAVNGKKKADVETPHKAEVKPPTEKQQKAPEIMRQVSPPQTAADHLDSRLSSPEMKSDESEPEFSFVREQSSSENDEEYEVKSVVTSSKQLMSSSGFDEDDDDQLDAEFGDDETSKLKSISNREARAAKRAAAASKRREEVEHRRKMKEEQGRKEKDEAERQIILQQEMEEQRRKGEEDRRLRKQQQMEDEERELHEAEEAERRQKLEAEREKRAKEEYQRKLDEMRRKQHEEESRKRELMLIKQREEEEQKAAEDLMLSKMAKEERMEYERIKREKEEEKRRKDLADRLRQAEEAKAAMEQAQRLAAEMAKKQAELEARLRFNRSLQQEASCLSQAHEINRAFVFSYFELLQWLGLDVPEFELAKLTEF